MQSRITSDPLQLGAISVSVVPHLAARTSGSAEGGPSPRAWERLAVLGTVRDGGALDQSRNVMGGMLGQDQLDL